MSYRPDPETVAFMKRLVAEIPVLDPLYQEHLKDFDEMLPHLLMADFARYAVANAQDTPSRFHLRKLLDCLEDGLRSDNENVHNVIAASFAENLQGEDRNAIDILKRTSGPLLTKRIEILGL